MLSTDCKTHLGVYYPQAVNVNDQLALKFCIYNQSSYLVTHTWVLVVIY